MALSSDLIEEFAAAFDTTEDTPKETTCYGEAHYDGGNEFVKIDGARGYTPATFTVPVKEGDRVLIIIKNRRAIVIGNVTSPTLIVGTLQANDAIIVNGYLTTNANRTTYNDTSTVGVTFSSSGIGGNGGNGKYWTLSNTGELFATSATITGRVTATEGYIGGTSGWVIGDGVLYTNGHATSSANTDGVFLSPSEVSGGKGGVWYLKANGDFRLGGANGINYSASTGVISLGSGVSLTWESISNPLPIPSDVNQLNDASGQKWSTTVGENFIKTTDVIAQNLVVKAAKIDGKLTASQISATTLSSITANLGEITGGSIRIGTAVDGVYPFNVTNQGVLSATGASISGEIKASSGKIGGDNGWVIGTSAIYNGTDSMSSTTVGTFIGVSGFRQYASNTAYVNIQNGVITAVGASISGNVTITGGGITLGTPTKFSVTSAGVLSATGADISGVITATTGYIGGTSGWVIKAGAIHTSGHTAFDTGNDGIYIGVDKIACGNGGKFYVGQDGVPHCNGSDLHINTLNSSSRSSLCLDYLGTTIMRINAYVRALDNSMHGYVECGGRLALTANELAVSGMPNSPAVINVSAGSVDITCANGILLNTYPVLTSNNWSSYITFPTKPSFGYKQYTISNQTIAAGSYTNNPIKTAIDAPTGYTFLCFRAVTLSGSRSTFCNVYELTTADSGTNFAIGIRNMHATDDATVTITLIALFVANATLSSLNN